MLAKKSLGIFMLSNVEKTGIPQYRAMNETERKNFGLYSIK
jgi:hypothetical protein